MLPLLVPALSAVLAQAPTEAQADLAQARRLSADLRYEDALVEYQRYLGHPERPAAERAQALLEMGFLHLLLEDPVTAEQRTIEALELDSRARPADSAPQKHREWVERVRVKLADRPGLEVLAREDTDRPQSVRARVKDPRARASEVLLRHALVPTGPYRATPMTCQEGTCEGELPAPGAATSFTAWYFLEALDAQGNTVARAANPLAPLQLTVVESKPWYTSPWVYVGGAALVVGAASIFFVTSEPRK